QCFPGEEVRLPLLSLVPRCGEVPDVAVIDVAKFMRDHGSTSPARTAGHSEFLHPSLIHDDRRPTVLPGWILGQQLIADDDRVLTTVAREELRQLIRVK